MSRRTALVVAAALISLAVAGAAAGGRTARAASEQTYIVLYKQQGGTGGAAATVAKAGGRFVAAYPQIGVVIARSSDPAFAGRIAKDARIEGAAATGRFGVKLDDGLAERAAGTGAAQAAGAAEPLASLQWDMEQIGVPAAHEIATGNRSVLVGDIDSGLDWTHPDLAPNIDFANSASCESGAPDSDPAAWFDDNAHGTHTAGTIAAAVNGLGIAGVAPNVRIAAIRSGNDAGFLFPEMVICSFMWAADRHMDVTNNSYFMDPWYFGCRNDPEQRAIWKALQRAIRYAMGQGVTVVAALGNFSDDLGHPTTDIISPDTDFPDVEPRDITNACVVMPAEIPGVIGVTATGEQRLKASYSSYGSGVADVTAPGGDFVQTSEGNPTGDVLSTVPAWFGEFFEQNDPDAFDFFFEKDCTGGTCAYYAYFEGTSMATPHVTGVAALIASRYGHLPPGQMASRLKAATTPLPCPPNPYLWPDFPQFSNGEPQTCSGGAYNSFYGHGLIDALAAVGG